MSRAEKIVTSQIDGDVTARNEPNTYSYNSNGILVRHDRDRVGKRVVGPGVLYGANNDSGDQSGLNTIKLIPNEELDTDQYLVVDPTGPNHIHLRAGGTIDASNADLVIGGENTHVYISDADDQVTLKGSGGQFLTDPSDPNNQIATVGYVENNHGGFKFAEGYLYTDNMDSSYIESRHSDGQVSGELKFDRSNDQVILRAYGNFSENSYSSTDWATATWTDNGDDNSSLALTGAATVFTFLNNEYRNFNRQISLNGGTRASLDFWDGNGTDGTIYITGLALDDSPGENPITSVTFYASRASSINIDYDDDDLDISAENLDINLTTTGSRDINITSADDVTITASGDDIVLQARDDIRFTTGYNSGNPQYQWSMESDGSLQLPGQGSIKNPPASSGDNLGNDTLHLIPDTDLQVTDQYIIIDPTEINHIHIRAGGAQDSSEAELILGGERAGVRVSDSTGRVNIASKKQDLVWAYEQTGPTGTTYVVNTASAEPDINDFTVENGIKYTITSRTVVGSTTEYLAVGTNNLDLTFEAGQVYTFKRDMGENYWTFNNGGYLEGPVENGDLRVTGIVNDDGDLRVVSDSDNISINSGQDTNINANDAVRITTFGGDYGWDFGADGKFYGPGEDGALTIAGEFLTDNVNMSIRSNSQAVVLNGELGEFLGSSDDAASQIATIGDIETAQGAGANGEVTRWSPNFQATGLTFTGSGATYPTYNSHYVKNGRMVTFFIEIDMATVTNFGTGQYKTALPFAPLTGAMNHFQAWCLVDETANPDNTGHAILQADHLANTSVLDLHYIKQSGGANSPVMEALFKQGSPVTLTTATHVYINGTYITAE